MFKIIAGALAALLFFSESVAAEVRTWTGAGTTANWSDAGNWSGGLRPVDFDTLVFPPSPRSESRNDIANLLEVRRIEFRNSTHTIRGLPLRATDIVTIGDTANAVVGLDLTMTSYAIICACEEATVATLSRLAFAPGTRLAVDGDTRFDAFAGSSVAIGAAFTYTERSRLRFTGDIELSGPVTGAGAPVTITRGTFLLRNGATGLGQPRLVELDHEGELAIRNESAGEVVLDLPLYFRNDPGIAVHSGGPVRLRGSMQGFPELRADADVAVESQVGGDTFVIGAGQGVITLLNPANSFVSLALSGRLLVDNGNAVPLGASLGIGHEGELFLAAPLTLSQFSCGGRLNVLVGAGRVTGLSSLNGCSLGLAAPASFAPAPGAVIPIVENTSVATMTPIPGLPEGSSVTVGGVALRATYTALNGRSFALLAAGGSPGPAVVAVRGTPQSAQAGIAAGPMTVRAANADGSPRQNAVVAWSAESACGSWSEGGNPAIVRTDSQGLAHAPLFLLTTVSRRCVMTATLQDTGTSAAFEIFVYREGEVRLEVSPAEVVTGVDEPFEVVARVVSTVGLPLPNFVVQFSVNAGPDVASLFATGQTTAGPDNAVVARVTPRGTAATYSILVSNLIESKTVTVRQRAEPAYTSVDAPLQDMWWGGPAQNGWGMSVIQHGDRLFSVVYAYDTQGAPTWYVMPGGQWAGPSPLPYDGPIYAPTGTPFYAYDASRLVAGAPVGSVALRFFEANRASLSYGIGGTYADLNITRQGFGPRNLEPRPAVGDMWWGGPAQNGWGIAILKQHSNLFSVWFTYGADGRPTWFVMPSGTWTNASTYEGRIYRASGSPWVGAVYDPNLLTATDVGPFRFRFNGDTATFEYTVGERSGTLPIIRQGF